MYLSIIFLPLIGSLVTLCFGRFIGFRGAALITSCCTGLAFLLSALAFYEVGLCGSPCYVYLAPWFISELFDASWGCLFDSLTVVMLVVVTSVSTLVHIYSISYMSADPHLPRFMSYLSIFTFFMLMLVTADNFIQMFFGWEGVGLASYLLINFWYTRLQANKSAIKAMLMNRVGDFGLALGVMALFYWVKTVDFQTVFACAPLLSQKSFVFLQFEVDCLNCICILLFIGAVGKSAQLGLHTWLPDAMEGPTPVSALIHAATMVTAGVYLISRCSPLFEQAPFALMIVTFVGAMTCFFAATTGVMQNDLKRVIAYSTCSQLGYMVFACGLSNYSTAVFHLMNHAFFKALLFLSAGSIIHGMCDEQDMRKLGGVVQLLPFTYCMMFIGSCALVGFPYLSGFYSKDVILEFAYASYSVSGHFSYLIGTLCVFFTSYYSFRLIFLAFLTPTNAYRKTIQQVHEPDLLMAMPLVLLALGSLFVGFLGRDMMIGLGSSFWGASLYQLPVHDVMCEAEYIPQELKWLPFLAIFSGLLCSFVLTYWKTEWSIQLLKMPIAKHIYFFLNKRWYVDKVYNDWITYPALGFGYHTTFRLLDKGILELLGPLGLSYSVQQLIGQVSRLQSGYVYHYAAVMVLAIIILIPLIVLDLSIDPRLLIIWAVTLICS